MSPSGDVLTILTGLPLMRTLHTVRSELPKSMPIHLASAGAGIAATAAMAARPVRNALRLIVTFVLQIFDHQVQVWKREEQLDSGCFLGKPLIAAALRHRFQFAYQLLQIIHD